MNHVSVDSVQVFVAVASHGSIVRAADALGYTSSAISQRLSGLERDLGVSLFERFGNRVRISSEGEALVPAATAMLRAAEDFALAAASRVEEYRTIRVGGFASGLSLVARPAVDLLSQLGCEVRLVTAEDAEGIKDLRSGVLDLMLLQEYGVTTRREPDLVYSTVLAEPLMLISGVARPSLADAGSRRWAIPAASTVCGAGIRTLCRAAGFDPEIIADVDDFGLIVDLVRGREIHAVLPASAIPNDREGLHVAPLEGHERVVVAAHRATEQVNQAIATFLTGLTSAWIP